MEIYSHPSFKVAKPTKSYTVQQINQYMFMVIMLLLLLMSGCSSWNSSTIPVKVFPATHLNLNDEQRSLPVMVRVYVLKNKSVFERASFRQLWKQDKTTLGKNILWRKELIVKPNHPVVIKLKKSQKGKYIGVIAIFRQPQGKTWRDTKEIHSGFLGFKNQIVIRLYRNRVKIQ